MKKIIALSTVAFLSTAAFAGTNADKLSELEAKIAKLEKAQQKNKKKISAVNKLANKDNLKFNVDFRTSYDNLKYTTVFQDAKGSNEFTNDSLYSMRLWMDMGYNPADNMVFHGQLAYNKAFGASYGQRSTGMGFDTFDWTINENLTDDTLKVREAFWLWTPKVGDVGLTFSLGRRPSTNGYLANLREDDNKAKSPLGHVINMEFDGGSIGFNLDAYSPGLMFKLCFGRGLTNAASWASQASGMLNPMFPNTGNTPNYIGVDGALDNVDLAGFIFVPYDDGQYAVKTTWYRGFNVPGMNMVAATPTSQTWNMQTVGQMDGAAVSFKVDGIGDGISDFLDETTFFASYAWSKTNPDKKITQFNPMTGTPVTTSSMLGSTKSETGDSYWLGLNTPNLTGGKFGIEYNHGSKYWRPFTYGEDTMIGSKLATRGDAYEAYWSQPIVGDAFSMQVRYTYIDYEYTGSNGFFGQGGTPIKMSDKATLAMMGMNPVDTAQDLRIYFRYRY